MQLAKELRSSFLLLCLHASSFRNSPTTEQHMSFVTPDLSVRHTFDTKKRQSYAINPVQPFAAHWRKHPFLPAPRASCDERSCPDHPLYLARGRNDPARNTSLAIEPCIPILRFCSSLRAYWKSALSRSASSMRVWPPPVM